MSTIESDAGYVASSPLPLRPMSIIGSETQCFAQGAPSFDSTTISEFSRQDNDAEPHPIACINGPTTPEDYVEIDCAGDLVLDVACQEDGGRTAFLVKSSYINSKSGYFRSLLENKAFREGAIVAKIQAELGQRYRNSEAVSWNELPHLEIWDVGDISAGKGTKTLMTTFFQLLHDSEPILKKPSLQTLANLAIVADRFDTDLSMAGWLKHQLTMFKRPPSGWTEEAERQHLLIGFIFNYEPWVSSPSYRLIMSGSVKWNGGHCKQKGLWWDLPRGLEDELETRRDCILDKIRTIALHVLELYDSSQEKRCKLGYQTSPQCDSYQLGHLVRFFRRIGALNMRLAVGLDCDTDSYRGDLGRLLAELRSIPSWQLDENHHNCGPKKALTLCTAALEEYLKPSMIGICLSCWQTAGCSDRWSVRRPYAIHNGELLMPRDPCVLHRCHGYGCNFFCADKIDWNTLMTSRERRTGISPVQAISNQYTRSNPRV